MVASSEVELGRVGERRFVGCQVWTSILVP